MLHVGLHAVSVRKGSADLYMSESTIHTPLSVVVAALLAWFRAIFTSIRRRPSAGPPKSHFSIIDELLSVTCLLFCRRHLPDVAPSSSSSSFHGRYASSTAITTCLSERPSRVPSQMMFIFICRRCRTRTRFSQTCDGRDVMGPYKIGLLITSASI